MAKLKTTTTKVSVDDFISKVPNETRRDDARELIKIYKAITGFEPVMWGPSIIGFGQYHYKYDSGHEGDMPLTAFSPRKDSLVIYLYASDDPKGELFKKLGKFRSSKACVYVKKLEDIDVSVLKKLITASIKKIKTTYG